MFWIILQPSPSNPVDLTVHGPRDFQKEYAIHPLFITISLTSLYHIAGHGKPVDVWAMGVVTYFLLAGYTPFDRDSQQLEMEAIIAGDYKFEPKEYWANVSDTAKDFVKECLTIDPTNRPTAAQVLEHKVYKSTSPRAIHFVKYRQPIVAG